MKTHKKLAATYEIGLTVIGLLMALITWKGL